MVGITDFDSAQAWLKTQDRQTQVWFATRCALRALPALGRWEDATSSRLVFATCRATLISAAASTCPTEQIKELETAVAASYFIPSRFIYRSSSTTSLESKAAADEYAGAVYSAAHSAASDNVDVAFSAATSYSIAAHADPAAAPAAALDAQAPKNWDALWPKADQPRTSQDNWDALKAQWKADGPHWSFWIDWYERILAGDPMDWALIFMIAKEISDEDWDAGQARVADRIAEIEKAHEEQTDREPRQPAFEPKTIEFLYSQQHILTASAQSMAIEISSAFESFRNKTGINETPDAFEPLERVPRSLNQISLLLSQNRTIDREQALREEVGRLNAKIAHLEAELAKLRDADPPVFAPALKEQVAKSLGDWKLYGALCAGLWIISGDDTGL